MTVHTVTIGMARIMTMTINLYKWGVQKLFQTSYEVIIRELKIYVEDMGKLNIKRKIQLLRTMFLENHGSLDIYDEDLKEIFIIDHKKLQFNKISGWAIIGIPEEPDGTLSNHEYFCIHDDLFDRIQSTYQDRNILWMFI